MWPNACWRSPGRVAQRHLSAQDSTERTGNGLVVRFGEADEHRATRVSAAIHAELHRVLRAVAPSHWETALFHAAERATLLTELVFAVSGKRGSMVLGRLQDVTREALTRAAERDGCAADLGRELTLLQLAAAARWFRADAERTLVLPVPFEAASRRLLDRLAELCRALPDSWRVRLVFELCHLRPGTPRHRILELVRALAPMCHGVAVELPAPEVTSLPAAEPMLVFASITADDLLSGGNRQLALPWHF